MRRTVVVWLSLVAMASVASAQSIDGAPPLPSPADDTSPPLVDPDLADVSLALGVSSRGYSVAPLPLDRWRAGPVADGEIPAAWVPLKQDYARTLATALGLESKPDSGKAFFLDAKRGGKRAAVGINVDLAPNLSVYRFRFPSADHAFAFADDAIDYLLNGEGRAKQLVEARGAEAILVTGDKPHTAELMKKAWNAAWSVLPAPEGERSIFAVSLRKYDEAMSGEVRRRVGRVWDRITAGVEQATSPPEGWTVKPFDANTYRVSLATWKGKQLRNRYIYDVALTLSGGRFFSAEIADIDPEGKESPSRETDIDHAKQVRELLGAEVEGDVPPAAVAVRETPVETPKEEPKEAPKEETLPGYVGPVNPDEIVERTKVEEAPLPLPKVEEAPLPLPKVEEAPPLPKVEDPPPVGRTSLSVTRVEPADGAPFPKDTKVTLRWETLLPEGRVQTNVRILILLDGKPFFDGSYDSAAQAFETKALAPGRYTWGVGVTDGREYDWTTWSGRGWSHFTVNPAQTGAKDHLPQ